jgi:hypothetical protein
MKQKVFAWILVLILALTPVLAIAEGENAGEGLAIDTEHVYPDMEKSYANGYTPMVTQKDTRILLPLVGNIDTDTISVTAKLPADGPFAAQELSFDVVENTYDVKNADGTDGSAKAFLIDCTVPLNRTVYNGTYFVRFIVRYGNSEEQAFSIQVSITERKTRNSSGQKSLLLIENSAVTPTETVGNDAVTITLTIANDGQKEARNIYITAIPQDADIVLTSDLNGIYLERLAVNEVVTVQFDLRVARHALEGDHLVKIDLKYEGKTEGEYTSTASYRIHVAQPVELAYDAIKLPEKITSGDTYTQIIYVYNPSCATAYNVRGVLNVDGLICSSAYLGNIAPQGEATKELSVFVTTLSGSQKYGDTWGSFELHYENENGEEQVLYQDLKGTILEPVKITDEEKERHEKEQKEQQTLSQWWISLLVAIAVIVILVTIIVIARFSRLLRMK